MAPSLEFLLFSLDDHELDLAISEQESMAKSALGANKHMQVALSAYHAERCRRMESHAAPTTITTHTTAVNDLGDSDASSETTADKHAAAVPLAPPASPAPLTPKELPRVTEAATVHRGKRKAVRFASSSEDVRPVRVRFTPMRYGERTPETSSSKKRKYDCPELQEQYEANQVTRAQLLGNQHAIEDTAAHFACALTARKPRAVHVTPNGKRHDTKTPCPWMGAQAQKLAVADDGYYYDFHQITQYIRDNAHKQLRSPRTGEPMSGQVYYVGKCKATKKPKTCVWTREIFVREELAAPDSDDEASTQAPSAECVAVD
jgi:hypothetical protein